MSKSIFCVGCSAADDFLDAPIVPEALAPLPGDLAWLVPVEFQGQPLTVGVPRAWEGYENESSFHIDFEFYWDGKLVGSVRRLPPFDPISHFPVLYDIPVEHFSTAGTRTLFYRGVLEDGNYAGSPEILVEIDHRAPNSDNPGSALIFPPEVVVNGVTQAWLAANGDQLTVEVPRWPDMKLEDRVLLYWGGPFEPEPVVELVIDSSHLQPGTPIEASYPGDVLRAYGNGQLRGYYVLADRAGNRNDPSPPVAIEVIDLPAVPRELPPPVIPLASVDGLIDLEDARTGVQVEIGPINDTVAGDTLQAWWNGRPLPLITLGANPQWPQRVPVGWPTLSADGFAGTVPCEVYYQWQRGGGAGKDSAPTRFDVDLSVAGPDPVDPGPINPALERVVVKGLTADNVLVGPDHGRDALVQVALYGNPAAGELLELHWGAHPQVAAAYRVQAADQPGKQILFTVPWAIIEAEGNDPALPTWYWVSNGVNRQRSADTLVRVAVMPLEGLGPVSFPDATVWGWINCELTPWNGIRVRIPGNPELLAADDLVELSWQLCVGTTGENPITEHVLFPPRRLTAAEAQDGLEVMMDRFTDLVLPIQLVDGSANVRYHLTKVDGTPGIASNKVLRISLVRPGHDKPCDGTQ